MASRRVCWFVVACACVWAVGLAAQRGGGRGGGMNFERPETPTSFESADLGLKFDVPAGLQLFTEKMPGRYRNVLKDGKFMYLADPNMKRASVVAKATPNMTQADVDGYKSVLEANPPQAKLEGFKKQSVKTIKIGKHQDKDALEFIYDVSEGNMPSTVRQVVFVHNGKGFTFTCTSFQAEYGGADKVMFQPLFSQLEFK